MGKPRNDEPQDSYDMDGGVILPLDEHQCAPDNLNQDFAHFGADPNKINYEG